MDAMASRGRRARTGAGVRFCQRRGRMRAIMWACVLCPPCTAWAAHIGRARRFTRNHKSGGVCWVATATRVSVGLKRSNQPCAFASGKTRYGAPMPHPFHSDAREKGERGSFPGSKSDSGPRLSLGNSATFGPKVPYFTADFFAGSHRLRARAPEIRESPIGLADPGPPKAGAKVDGKTRHF